jgi:hypothetical protein
VDLHHCIFNVLVYLRAEMVMISVSELKYVIWLCGLTS